MPRTRVPASRHRRARSTGFAFTLGSGLRLDSGVEDGSEVSVHYDPMLAKVIAWAPTRAEAAAKLANTLARAHLHGPHTIRDLLVRILRHPEFIAGATDTHFLQRHPAQILGAPLCDAAGERLHALAATLALQAGRRARGGSMASIPSGWRNVPSQDQEQAFEGASGRLDVRYRFGREGLSAQVNGDALEGVRVHACAEGEVDLEVSAVRYRYAVHTVGERVFVDSALGASDLRELPRFAEPEIEIAAGSLVAPMPGVVKQIYVIVGAHVAKGDLLMVLEAMKTEIPIRAPQAGTVTEIGATVGIQVAAGAILAVIEAESAGDKE